MPFSYSRLNTVKYYCKVELDFTALLFRYSQVAVKLVKAEYTVQVEFIPVFRCGMNSSTGGIHSTPGRVLERLLHLQGSTR